MTPETIVLTGIAVAAGVYGVAAFVGYLWKHSTQLILPGADDPAPAPAGAEQPPVATSGGGQAELLLRRWFAGKSCAICGRAIPPIHRVEVHPGLMNTRSATRDLIPWEDIVRNEQLPATLESHAPVCSNCIMAETFRRKFPDFVIDRPEHGGHVH
jgi:hypothetical protein